MSGRHNSGLFRCVFVIAYFFFRVRKIVELEFASRAVKLSDGGNSTIVYNAGRLRVKYLFLEFILPMGRNIMIQIDFYYIFNSDKGM